MPVRKTDEDLEEIAKGFRKQLGLEHQVRPDMLTVITKIKQLAPPFNYCRVPDEKMPDAEAQWDSEKYTVRMRESVFVGIQRGEARARWAVAHELSHFVLKHEGLLNRSVQKTISERTVARVRFQEAEARRLAAIILAPEYLVPNPATVEELISGFGLSNEAAIYRRDEIDQVRRRRAGIARGVPTSIADFLREQKRRGYPVTSIED